MGKTTSKRTEKQKNIKKQIVDFWNNQLEKNGDPPTYNEIVQETGLSLYSVQHYLHILEEEGVIMLELNKHRLSKREKAKKRIVEFCKKQIEGRGYHPSYNDIFKETGIPISTLRRYMAELEEEGVIKFVRGSRGRVISRTVTFVEKNEKNDISAYANKNAVKEGE